MDLRSVRRFLAVAETGSLNKAAGKLNISQPALSKSIQLLEYSVGAPLFNRSPQGISLTTFGESVFEHGRRIEAELRRMKINIDAIRSLGTGEVNVGAPLGPDSRLLALAILRLVTDTRRITFNVANGTRADLIRPLQLGDLDFLIATLFEPEDLPSEFEQKELYKDSMTIAVRADHPILSDEKVDLNRLSEYAWVVLTGNRDIEQALRGLIGIEHTKSIIRSGSPMFVKNILLRSDLIGLVRQDSMRNEFETGVVKEIDISEIANLSQLVPPLPVGLIMRSDISMTIASQALIAEIVNVIAELKTSITA